MTPSWNATPHHDGMYANYRRLHTLQTYTPPFTFSGRVRLNDVMDPGVFGWGWKQGQAVTYRPSLVFHPMYVSNDHNVLISIGSRANPTACGISAELRSERPQQPYGVRTGYEQRIRNPIEDPMDQTFHRFAVVVHSHAHYQLRFDSVTVADVIEKEPATIPPGPVAIGMRLDFLSVDFAGLTVDMVGTLCD